MSVDEGIIVIKYWFSASDAEQQRCFSSRLEERRRQWKLSETDLLLITKWEDYSRAKDDVFTLTDIEHALDTPRSPTTDLGPGLTQSVIC